MSSKLTSIMSEYFSHGNNRILSEALPKEVPIQAKKSNWKITEDNTSLFRQFDFDDQKIVKYFVNELLSLEESLNHHGLILIDDKSVKVKVKTKILNKVTEIDIEYASHLDKIFDEIGNYELR